MRGLLVLVACVFILSTVPVAIAHHEDTDEHAHARVPLPIVLYHHYTTLQEEMKKLAADHPDKFQYKVIGKSVEGLDIYGGEISDFEGGDIPLEDRYRLYFDGSIHSNEQLGMEMTMDIVNFLLGEYDTNATAKWIVDNRRTFFVPLVNPDGNVRDSRQNAHMVDLNRNFPHGWGGPGSNAKGPSPLSEPETQAVAAFIREVRPHYLQSFHTGTVMLLHPYGSTDKPSPEHDVFTKICEAVHDPMQVANDGREVPCGQVYTTIYPASGATVDFAYVELGTISWTYEVDDEQNLMVSITDIRSRLREVWIAMEHAFLHVERYGALLVIEKIQPIIQDGAVVGVDLHIRNDGLGAPNNTVAYIGDEKVSVPALGSGNSTVLRVDSAQRFQPGADFSVGLHYNKTFYKGFSDDAIANVKVDLVDGALTLTPVEKIEVLKALEVPVQSSPGVEFALLLGAVAFMVGLRRRTG